MPARIRDEKIPLKHDVIAGDNRPSGTLKAWRTIPSTLDVHNDIESMSGAWYLTLPIHRVLITETILKPPT